MLLYQTVLFDLDGTLIESAPGIFACARAVMQEMGLPPMTDAQLRPMVGPPLAVCFSDVIGVPKDRVQEAVDRYHLLAKTVGLDAIHPYPGIPALLAGLKAAGACVCVVTSKVTPTAQAHLERCGLAPFIDRLWGGIPGGSAEKTFLLQTALDALHAKKLPLLWWVTGIMTFAPHRPSAFLPSACCMATAAPRRSLPARRHTPQQP